MKEKRYKFCPQCGKKTEELFNSLCKTCFLEGIKLLEVGNLEITVCKGCHNYFKGEKKTSIEKIIKNFIRKEITKNYGYTVENIEIEEIKLKDNSNSAMVLLKVSVMAKGVKIEEEEEKEVIFKKEICERCSKKAAGYYEAIVQLRAKNRIPTEKEQEIAFELAYFLLDEEDFISKVEKLKKGLNLYVSSIESGRKISKEIIKRLGGVLKESKKLVGKKEGRNVYRVSFSVRLPS